MKRLLANLDLAYQVNESKQVSILPTIAPDFQRVVVNEIKQKVSKLLNTVAACVRDGSNGIKCFILLLTIEKYQTKWFES